ncbi:MAG: UDP-2,4-diacetamido-2,4,6-trideoxy-beta-L-altropyranose hydrolase, partial [Phycisphaerae bacterium]|nr:UDP-2,4-diacetamido-2,4,6-trideoxy-beta-L-altropyranose hydrolase [Phycisphaerae bacterium]
MNIVFRTDASSEIGTGHVMRCVTLANKLRDNRATCTFICRDHIGNLVNHIKEQGFTVHVLPLVETSPIDNDLDHAHWLGCSRDTDAKETKEILNSIKPEWLVGDHYALDITW